MIVGWVGTTSDAKRIERLVIAMAQQSFQRWDITSATGLGAASSNSSSNNRGFEILATPAWLVVYILLANCAILRPHPEADKKRRLRAFHTLTELAALACKAAAKPNLRTEIKTPNTTFFFPPSIYIYIFLYIQSQPYCQLLGTTKQ